MAKSDYNQKVKFNTFTDILKYRAQSQPDRISYTFSKFTVNDQIIETSITNKELYKKAMHIAGLLYMADAKVGDRALLLYPSSLEYITAFYGCLLAGIIAVPLYPPLSSNMLNRIKDVINDSKAKFFLTSDQLKERLNPVLDVMLKHSQHHCIAIDNSDTDKYDLDEKVISLEIKSNSIAFLQYTSGSTSQPKGVILTHGNLIHNMELISYFFKNTPDTRMVSWLPPYHDMGLIGGIMYPFFSNYPAYLLSPIDFIKKPLRWIKLISKNKATLSGAPNFAYDLCVRNISPEDIKDIDLSSWTLAFNGAEPVKHETINEFSKVFKSCSFREEAFYPTYGLAEATLIVSGGSIKSLPIIRTFDSEKIKKNKVRRELGFSNNPKILVSNGNTCNKQEIIIVNPDTMMQCKSDEIGEIWIKSRSIAKGYWEKPEETKNKFKVYLKNSKRGPYLRTGDLGFFDNGELFITGRLKDMLIIRGRNIYPQDIELTVEKVHPALRHGCNAVFAVDVNGEEKVVIAQEIEKEYISDFPLNEIIKRIIKAVSENHNIDVYSIVFIKPMKIPKTTSGKIQRSACRIGFLERSLDIITLWQNNSNNNIITSDMVVKNNEISSPSEITINQIASWFKKKIANMLKIKLEAIDIKEPFTRYGLNSSDAISICGELERIIGQEVSPTLIYDYPDIESFSNYLVKMQKNKVKNNKKDIDRKKTNYNEGIAIIGMACRFPGKVESPESFWHLIENGGNGIIDPEKKELNSGNYYKLNRDSITKEITFSGGYIEDVDKFDASFFGISPREAEFMDPQQRVLLEICWEALERSGIVPLEIRGSKTGVFIGISNNDYSRLLNWNSSGINFYFGTGNALSISANRLSYLFDLKGPSMAIDTACSSSLVAVHHSCVSLHNRECNLAIAGGVNIILSEDLTSLFYQGGMISSDGRCKSFDVLANGYVRSEGCGIVVLKRLSDATRDGDKIMAVIKGSAVNHDGKSNGLTAPNGPSQRMVILEALKNANLKPAQISYIEAHGTGTSLGDPIEVNTLNEVLTDGRTPNQKCWIGSVKTNIGHLEAAAGIASLIKTVLAMQNKKIPGNLHFNKLNPLITINQEIISVPTKTVDWHMDEVENKRYAGVSSFGFGGTNAHIILEEYEEHSDVKKRKSLQKYNDPQLVLLSAKNNERLNDYAKKLIDFLEKDYNQKNINGDQINLQDIAYTLQAKREAMSKRLAFIVTSKDELRNKLNLYCHGNVKIDKEINEFKLLLNDSNKKEIIENITKNKDLNKIRQAWLLGEEINWNGFYQSQKPMFINLPTYPFVRERYWLPEEIVNSNEQYYNKIIDNRLHILIDSNISKFNKVAFNKVFKKEDYYIRDHVIEDKLIIPGAVYLEMARVAGEIAGERKVKKLKNFLIGKPIELIDKDKEVIINLNPYNESIIGYEIYSIEKNEKNIHVQGEIDYTNEKHEENEKKIKIEELKKKLTIKENGKHIYNQFKMIGLDYGVTDRTIDILYGSNTEALAKLVLHENNNSANEFILNPSLLDGAFHTAIWIGIKSGYQNEPLYLFYITEMEIIEGLKDTCYAHAKVIDVENIDQKNEIKIKVNINIYDEEGNILVKIKELIGKKGYSKKSLFHESTNNINYEIRWEIKEVKERDDEFSELIIFDHSESVFNQVKKKINKIILVKPMENYKEIGENIYGINPQNITDYKKLLTVLLEKGFKLNTFIHLWNYSKNEIDLSRHKDLNSRLITGINSLFNFSKVLMELRLNRKIRLLYLNYETKIFLQPYDSAIKGFMTTLQLENPNFEYHLVRIDKKELSGKEILQLITKEFLGSKEIEVKYEDDKRLIKKIVALKRESTDAIDIKENGVYLITGGAGGLGYIFMKYLIEKYKARVILIGRSKLNQEKRKRIEKMNNKGGMIEYIRADISKLDEAKRVIKEAKDHFKEINGIIHAAGIVDDALIMKKDYETFNRVIEPKVYGAINMDEATKKEELDLFIMFSSITSVLGNPGQSDYAFGNNFLDEYASYRNKLVQMNKRTGMTISINWPLWKEGGMKINMEMEKILFESFGMSTLESIKGLAAFEDILKSQREQVMVFPGEISNLTSLSQYKLIENNKKDSFEELKNDLNPNIDISYNNEQLFTNTLTYLMNLFSRELKIPVNKINPKDDFEKYGVDSYMIMKLSKEMENIFGRISKTLFFEYNNLDNLVQYFVDHYSKQIAIFFGYEDNNNEQEQDKITTINREKINAEKEIRLKSEKEMAMGKEENLFKQEINKESTENKLIDIAIIGISGRYPLADTLKDFWNNLKEGKDCISEIPKERWDYNDFPYNRCKWGGFISEVDKFDPRFFNISPYEAEIMDPQQRIFLEIAWQVVEDSGYSISNLLKSTDKKVGVFVGATWTEYELFSDTMHRINTDVHLSSIANRVSFHLGLQGPSLSIDTHCASSLTAIYLACESIRNGSSKAAIAGGVNLSIHPNKYCLMDNLLSTDGRCHSYGANGDGYVPSEGVGAVLLKPLERATIDNDHIYAVIKSYAINHSGKTFAYMVPNPNAQCDTVLDALNDKGINPRTISYIEGQGTGTALGDAVEITGLSNAFRKFTTDRQFCPLGSVKSNLGHLEAAGGMSQLTKVLLQLKHRQIVPSIHSNELNLNIDFESSPFFVNHELIEWKKPVIDIDGEEKKYPRRAGINTYGAGGTNVHIILEEIDNEKALPMIDDQKPKLIVLSAKNEERLRAYVDNLVKYLREDVLIPVETNKPGLDSYENKESLMKKILRDLSNEALKSLEYNKEIIDIDDDLLNIGFDKVQRAKFINSIIDKYLLDISPNILFENVSLSAFAQFLYQEYVDKIKKYYEKSDKEIQNECAYKLSEIAYTLQIGREQFEERLAIVVSSIAELEQKLNYFVQGKKDIAGLFRGNTERNSDNFKVLNEKNKNMISNIIKERKLEELAKYWVNGIEIDWKLLYPTVIPNRISLPTYPFARERYWISSFKNRHGFKEDLGINKSIIVNQFEKLDPQDHKELVVQYIQEKIGKIVGIDASLLPKEKPIFDMGFDSLKLMELKTRICIEMEIDISMEKFIENGSILNIAEILIEKLIINKNLISNDVFSDNKQELEKITI